MLVDIKLTLHQPRKRRTVSCVTVYKTVNSFSPYWVLHYSRTACLSDVHNFCQISCLAMNKYHLKNTEVFLYYNLDDHINCIYFQWCSMVPWLYSIESKTFKPVISKAKTKLLSNIFKISFLNIGVEIISAPHISHDLSVKSSLPADIKFYDEGT